MAIQPPTAKETVEVLRVRISGNRNDTISEGVIRIQTWSKKERTARAIKYGGLCWVGALASIVIPLLHFILVPGFLIAGPILAFVLLGQESMVLGGEGICPNCHASLPIASATLNFPISDLCTHCQTPLKIESI